MRCYVLISNKK